MRNLKLSLFASAMLLGSFTMTAQTADEVINKHVAAVGGDSWSKLTSMKTVATMTVQGMDLEMTEVKVKGKGVRSEMFMGEQSAGYKIVTPTSGWEFSAMQGDTKPKEMSAEDVKASQEELEITTDLADFKKKGLKAEYIGKEDIEGKSAHKLKIINEEGKSKITYFDASTFYKVRETETVETPQGEVEVTSDYSDFKKFPEGIVVSMKVKNPYQEISIKEVELNKPVADDTFKPSN